MPKVRCQSKVRMGTESELSAQGAKVESPSVIRSGLCRIWIGLLCFQGTFAICHVLLEAGW